MVFAAVTHLVEGLSLETLLTLKVEKSLICLVGTRRPTVSIIEQHSILFLKTLIRNKTSRFCRIMIMIIGWTNKTDGKGIRQKVGGDECIKGNEGLIYEINEFPRHLRLVMR
jgi:hypothetical protein